MKLKNYYQKSIVIAFSALLAIFFSSNSYSDSWEKTFGGGNSRGHSVQQTADGGYIITGSQKGLNTNVYLLKTDGNGKDLWERKVNAAGLDFGEPDQLTGIHGYWYTNLGYSVQQTADEGYIIVGSAFYSLQATGLVTVPSLLL